MESISKGLVQGNILNPFARPHARYLFFQLGDNPEQVRPPLKRLLQGAVTSAESQETIRAAWKSGGRQPTGITVGMFGLSFAGYQRLKLENTVPRGADDAADYFEGGLRNLRSAIWKPDLTQWSSEYRDNTMDGFLLLANDDPARLEQAIAAARNEIAGFGNIVAEETGSRRPVDGSRGAGEPFGFRDGIAGLPDPEVVFSAEPGIAGGFGSFVTYAKFEQNVPGFWSAVEEIVAKAKAKSLEVSADQVAAMAVGRRRNGEPLVPTGAKGINDFKFAGVPESVCPMQAHIRAMNPRNGPPPFQMIRRGIPYTSGNGSGDGSTEGFLFLSLHRSVQDFIGLLLSGMKSFDPILTRRADLGWAGPQAQCDGQLSQRWPIGGVQICHPMMDLVTLRGGEFFYAPSLPFIDSLA